MKVLIISNQYYNAEGVGNPIVYRITEAIQNSPLIDRTVFIPFKNKFKDLFSLRHTAKQFDVVHIHFGGIYALCILLFLSHIHAKKIITFHGSDIHAKNIKTTKSFKKKCKIKLNQIASFLSIFLCKNSGFVAKEMIDYVPKWIPKRFQKRYFIHKLGVDYTAFNIIPEEEACLKLQIPYNNYLLFSDVSNSSIKRRDIANAIIKQIPNFELLIMCGVKPQEVPNYINASKALILTSDQEGSPNIVRECLALNKPIYSVNVGDVSDQIKHLKKSAIISRNPKLAAKCIIEHLSIPSDNSREIKKKEIDLNELTKQLIVDIYNTK